MTPPLPPMEECMSTRGVVFSTCLVALLAFASLATSLGCAGGSASSGAGYVAEDTRLDSIGLIDMAVKAGRLDYSTGMLYKVYAVYDPMSLPSEYESDVPLRGAASLVSEVQRNWNRLTPEHRAEIKAYVQPVSDPERNDTGLDDVTPDRLDHERNRID